MYRITLQLGVTSGNPWGGMGGLVINVTNVENVPFIQRSTKLGLRGHYSPPPAPKRTKLRPRHACYLVAKVEEKCGSCCMDDVKKIKTLQLGHT